MTDLEWQILINIGPLAAFLALWWLLGRLMRGRQSTAVTVLAVNTEEMRRLTATLERLIDVLGREPRHGGEHHDG